MWFKRATGFGDLARRGGYVIALARNKVGSAAYLLRDHVMLFPAGGIRRMSPAEGVGRCSGCSWFHPHTLTPSHLPVLTPSLITPHPTPQYPWYMHTVCTVHTCIIYTDEDGYKRPECLRNLWAELEESWCGHAGPGSILHGLGMGEREWLKSLAEYGVLAVCVVWNLDSPLVASLHTVPKWRLMKSPPSVSCHGNTTIITCDASISRGRLNQPHSDW